MRLAQEAILATHFAPGVLTMDGAGFVAASAFGARGTVVQSANLPANIASDLQAFGRRIESRLAALERSGSCGSYEMQIARALLGSLLDAIDEMGPVASRE
ncbi:MAG: hypothetical protein WCJ30_11545 [Deltaproteobacteria bacterium]